MEISSRGCNVPQSQVRIEPRPVEARQPHPQRVRGIEFRDRGPRLARGQQLPCQLDPQHGLQLQGLVMNLDRRGVQRTLVYRFFGDVGQEVAERAHPSLPGFRAGHQGEGHLHGRRVVFLERQAPQGPATRGHHVTGPEGVPEALAVH